MCDNISAVDFGRRSAIARSITFHLSTRLYISGDSLEPYDEAAVLKLSAIDILAHLTRVTGGDVHMSVLSSKAHNILRANESDFRSLLFGRIYCAVHSYIVLLHNILRLAAWRFVLCATTHFIYNARIHIQSSVTLAYRE